MSVRSRMVRPTRGGTSLKGSKGRGFPSLPRPSFISRHLRGGRANPWLRLGRAEYLRAFHPPTDARTTAPIRSDQIAAWRMGGSRCTRRHPTTPARHVKRPCTEKTTRLREIQTPRSRGMAPPHRTPAIRSSHERSATGHPPVLRPLPLEIGPAIRVQWPAMGRESRDERNARKRGESRMGVLGGPVDQEDRAGSNTGPRRLGGASGVAHHVRPTSGRGLPKRQPHGPGVRNLPPTHHDRRAEVEKPPPCCPKSPPEGDPRDGRQAGAPFSPPMGHENAKSRQLAPTFPPFQRTPLLRVFASSRAHSPPPTGPQKRENPPVGTHFASNKDREGLSAPFTGIRRQAARRNR